MSLISTKDVLHQLAKDLTGKDSFRGITFSYAWLANQLGHFTLGFIPTLVIAALLRHPVKRPHPEEATALAVCIFWLIFELINFLGPLLLKRPYKASIIKGKRYVFVPPWGNIALDTFTDLTFFWLGALLACTFFRSSHLVTIILLSLVPFIGILTSYWYRTKIFLQEACYPIQFRLSMWDQQISDRNKQTVQEFLRRQDKLSHLLIFGTKKSGKTALSIGIATELSIRHKNCLYMPAVKIFSMFYEASTRPCRKYDLLWGWRSCSLLVIDDINPGDPVEEDLVSPGKLFEMIDNKSYGAENKAALTNKQVIWVMGNEQSYKQNRDGWVSMLHSIGVEDSRIKVVNLSDTD